jgi:hypothetical protein
VWQVSHVISNTRIASVTDLSTYLIEDDGGFTPAECLETSLATLTCIRMHPFHLKQEWFEIEDSITIATIKRRVGVVLRKKMYFNFNFLTA